LPAPSLSEEPTAVDAAPENRGAVNVSEPGNEIGHDREKNSQKARNKTVTSNNLLLLFLTREYTVSVMNNGFVG